MSRISMRTSCVRDPEVVKDSTAKTSPPPSPAIHTLPHVAALVDPDFEEMESRAGGGGAGAIILTLASMELGALIWYLFF